MLAQMGIMMIRGRIEGRRLIYAALKQPNDLSSGVRT